MPIAYLGVPEGIEIEEKKKLVESPQRQPLIANPMLFRVQPVEFRSSA